jgi:DNA-binding NarL/FixJ family response regulator
LMCLDTSIPSIVCRTALMIRQARHDRHRDSDTRNGAVVDRIRVVLADDHPVLRRGLRALLATLEAVVVGEAATGREAVRAAVTLRPDLVMMDLAMPDGDGIAATREIVRRVPDTAVLILTLHEEDQRVVEALRAGARGYLLKSAGEEELVHALGAIRHGDLVIGSALAGRITKLLGAGELAPAEPFPELTAAEVDVITLVGEGLTNAAIARRLRLSPRTIRNRLSVIFHKLGVDNRTQAALLARQRTEGRDHPPPPAGTNV